LAEFVGAFDRVEYRKILKFYPMLIVNGVLPPLVLIMVRSTLTSHLGLHSAGLWQATWRLSEAYLVILIFSVSMYFMPGMGEHAEAPREQRRHILRTFAMVSAVTTALAVAILILKAPIVAIIFGPGFDEVTTLLPLQLLGDVLKMGGWILAMALVGTLRTRWFIVVTAATSIVFVGLSEWLIPSAGIHGVLQAYVCSGAVHIALAAYGLRDILVGRRPLLGAPTARNE
jgi:PST family polysaccharide transporter